MAQRTHAGYSYASWHPPTSGSLQQGLAQHQHIPTSAPGVDPRSAEGAVGISPGGGAVAHQASQSLPFQSELELRQLDVSYRWWEHEAETTLYAFNTVDIKRLIQFHLYRDDNLPRTILNNRHAETVAGFLASLLPPEFAAYPPPASHPERVEQLLSICQAEHIAPRPWSWIPTSTFSGPNAEHLASAIDRESFTQFKTVPFEGWVQYSLGYPSSSVEWFLLQHRDLYFSLCTHFASFPSHGSLYSEVEMLLRNRSPFAHRAVYLSLRDRALLGSTDPSQSRPLVDFLVNPIQALFRGQSGGLSLMLKRLAVLALRFKRTYSYQPTMDWVSPFNTKTPYFDEIFSAISPQAFARKITLSDENSFSGLSLQSFKTNDATLHQLTDNWNVLVAAVEECCTTHPELYGLLRNRVEVLFKFRNYYSATALLHGMQKSNSNILDLLLPTTRTSASSTNPPEQPLFIFHLLNPLDNYAGYRRIRRERPGLPFLFPHINEYRTGRRDEVAAMFPLPDLCAAPTDELRFTRTSMPGR